MPSGEILASQIGSIPAPGIVSLGLGPGSDGDVIIAVDTKLTANMYYNNLTVNAGINLAADGHLIYVKGTLTNNGVISAIPVADLVGLDGGNASGGAGAGTLFNGYDYGVSFTSFGKINGGGEGVQGGVGSNGTDGGNGYPYIPSSWATYGMGGRGALGGAGGGVPGVSKIGGSPGTQAPVMPCKDFSMSPLIFVKYEQSGGLLIDILATGGSSGSGGGSGAGDGGMSFAGGGSGSGGKGGGCLYIVCNELVNNGVISADGGAGGNGGNGEGNTGAGGGGGGYVKLAYNTATVLGTIHANGGAGGGPGTGGAATSSAQAGDSGTTGYVIKFDMTAGTVTVS